MDKFAALWAAETNGINYDLETSDVVQRLVEWDQRFGIDIEDVEFDGLTVRFHRLPTDLEDFVHGELMEFCPDTFAQGGYDDPAELVDEIRRTREVQLWWD